MLTTRRSRNRIPMTVEVTITVPISIVVDRVPDEDGAGNQLAGPDTYVIDEIEVEDGATLQRLVRAAIKETCMGEIQDEIRKEFGSDE